MHQTPLSPRPDAEPDQRSILNQKMRLFWLCYNVVAIPIAAIGLLHPLIGVIAMVTSSLSVIGNSLLLQRAKLTVDR